MCIRDRTYSYDESQRVRAHVYDEESGLKKDVDIEYEGVGVLKESDIVRKTAYLKQVKIA